MSFIQSDDFDESDEPTVGDVYTVKANGSVVYRRASVDPWIYDHKWLFVADAYTGFDVEASKERSGRWLALDDIDYRRIGKRSFWQTHVLPRLNCHQENIVNDSGHRQKIARTSNAEVRRGDLRSVTCARSGDLRTTSTKENIVNESQISNSDSGETEWLRSDAARKVLQVSTCDLAHLRQEGKIAFRKEGNAYLYSARDCEQFAWRTEKDKAH